MTMLIGMAAQKLAPVARIGMGKLIVASPFIFAGAYAGSQIAGMTQSLKGPQDPNRAMASTANAAFAALPGAGIGVATMVAGKKLAAVGAGTGAAALAKYGAAMLVVTGAGATLGALGAGGILQQPLDLARGMAEKGAWQLARQAAPWLPEDVPKVDLNIPSLFHDMTSVTTRTTEEYDVHLEQGEQLDPMKVVHVPDGSEVLELTEVPGVDGGTTFSEFNDRITPAPEVEPPAPSTHGQLPN